MFFCNQETWFFSKQPDEGLFSGNQSETHPNSLRMYTGRAGSAFQCQQMYDSCNKNINTTNVDTVHLLVKVLGYTIQDLIKKYILNLREVFLFVVFRLIYTTISNPQKLQRQHRSLKHRDGPYSLYRRVKN